MYFVVDSCDGRQRISTFTTCSGRYSGDQIRYVEVATKVVNFVVTQRKEEIRMKRGTAR